jgi:uncharacterized membrane protein YtjA (UPF0391 family)
MSLIKWAIVFAIVSLIAALFGFGGIAQGSADIARMLFYLFLVITVILFLLGAFAFRTVAGPPV